MDFGNNSCFKNFLLAKALQSFFDQRAQPTRAICNYNFLIEATACLRGKKFYKNQLFKAYLKEKY